MSTLVLIEFPSQYYVARIISCECGITSSYVPSLQRPAGLPTVRSAHDVYTRMVTATDIQTILSEYVSPTITQVAT